MITHVYRVAAWYRFEGYGGYEDFSTAEEAVAHARHMQDVGGYKNVHVWKQPVGFEYILKLDHVEVGPPHELRRKMAFRVR